MEKLRTLPDKPGVYLMKDRQGRVLYVGKASSLRSRVRSYFQAGGEQNAKTRWMVGRIEDVETFTVDSEMEALMLECNLIKRHRPYFNIKYRDDKRYPMLEVTIGEAFPRIRVVRRPRSSRHRYFGPYPDAGALRRTIKILQKVFQIRTCGVDMQRNHRRPCLDYYIALCTAPCTRFVDQARYREQVEQAIEFLDGHSENLIRRLDLEMEKEAKTLNFERCARLRDMLWDLRRTAEEQKVVLRRPEDEDYVALDSRKHLACAQVMQVREGKLVGQRTFVLDAHGPGGPPEQLAAFLKEYYNGNTFVPRRVLLSEELEERELLETWLVQKRGSAVELRVPVRGTKRKLMELALRNALEKLELELSVPTQFEARREGLEQLRQVLGLPEPPWRIECVDISNLHGREAVGSLVVFDHGMPRRDHYRRFRIRSGDTPDDYRMMGEVLRRRFRPSEDEDQRRKFSGLPDLLVVDGGKGQLGVACRVLRDLDLQDQVPVAGLAKENEWLYVTGSGEPVVLPRGSKGLALVTHLRDEAHRFAITYHRKLREKKLKKSLLDQAPGIGRGRKQALLKHFGSVARLAEASEEELAQVEGIGAGLARKLRNYLQQVAPAFGAVLP